MSVLYNQNIAIEAYYVQVYCDGFAFQNLIQKCFYKNIFVHSLQNAAVSVGSGIIPDNDIWLQVDDLSWMEDLCVFTDI